MIDITDSDSESEDEDDVQLIMDYESQDSSSADSGLYDITQDSATSEGEEVDLFDYIDDPWEENHYRKR